MKVFVVMHYDYSSTHLVDVFLNEKDAVEAADDDDSVEVMHVYEDFASWQAVQDEEMAQEALRQEQYRIQAAKQAEKERLLMEKERLINSSWTPPWRRPHYPSQEQM